MSTTSAFNKKMSLYIPRVDTRSLPNEFGCPGSSEYLSSAKEFISKQFSYQGIGEVDRVDLVSKKTPDGYTFYIAFVHFNEWFDTVEAHSLQDAIVSGEKAMVHFHKHWFWIVTENRNPRAAEEVDLREVVMSQQKEIDALTESLGELVREIGTTRWDDDAEEFEAADKFATEAIVPEFATAYAMEKVPDDDDFKCLPPPPPPGVLTRQTAVEAMDEQEPAGAWVRVRWGGDDGIAVN